MAGHDPARSGVLRFDALKGLRADRDITTAGDLAAELNRQLSVESEDGDSFQ